MSRPRRFLPILSVCVLPLFAANPVPFIQQPLRPMSISPRGTPFTLVVTGTGFVNGSSVHWNGTPLTTSFVGSKQLKALVPGSYLHVSGAAVVTVVNPGPGGGTSNAVPFELYRPRGTVILAGRDSATDAYPQAIVTADFNHDGKLDIATANQTGTVSVLLGNGDGTFQDHVDYMVVGAGEANGLAVGDFNGDGNLDIVVPGSLPGAAGSLYLLLGNGDGTFQPPGTGIAAGKAPTAIAAADLNGDGNLDVVVTNQGDSSVSVFLGKGDGSFGRHTEFATGLNPDDIALGDFNGDGIIDIATADYGGCDVQILGGRGDGTFFPRQQLTAGCAEGITTADLNGDGKLDLIAADLLRNTISIYFGDGTGTFSFAQSYSVPDWPERVVVGDFNTDGIPDIATANFQGSTSVLLGNGDGTFQDATTIPTGNVSWRLTAGDFNSDGHLDLVLANFGTSITTMLQSTLAIAPASLAFPLQSVGTTSPVQAVTLTNTDYIEIGVGAISITGANAADFTVKNLNCGPFGVPGHSCTLQVRFSPTAGGLRTATLSVVNNNIGVAQTVSLTGTGTIAAFSTTSLNFGTVAIGQTGGPLPVTLTNAGSVTLNISSIHIGGLDKTDFAEQDDCGGSLAPNNSCTVNVTFTPSATGTRSGLLVFNDDGGGSPQSISLSGTGQ